MIHVENKSNENVETTEYVSLVDLCLVELWVVLSMVLKEHMANTCSVCHHIQSPFTAVTQLVCHTNLIYIDHIFMTVAFWNVIPSTEIFIVFYFYRKQGFIYFLQLPMSYLC